MQIGRLNDLANNRKDLDINRALRFVFSLNEVKEFAMDLNRWEQIFEQRVNSEGWISGLYAEATERKYRNRSFYGKKKIAGEPYFLLIDEDFFNSFYVTVYPESFEIGATDMEKLFKNPYIMTPELLPGFTEENLEVLAAYITTHVRAWLLDQLLKEK